LVEDFLFYHVRMLPTLVSSYLLLYPGQLRRYWLATDVGIRLHFLLSSSAYIINRC
jgi:hypothetical protein